MMQKDEIIMELKLHEEFVEKTINVEKGLSGMTDVEKRRKVMRGLECCADNDINRCKECPYCPWKNNLDPNQDNYCFSVMAKDALALLKDQEARVMTKEEITRYPDVWLEELTEPQYPLCPVSNGRLDPDEESDIRFEFPCCEHGYYSLSQYGKTWRCWTARPTEEQRKAVKWE